MIRFIAASGLAVCSISTIVKQPESKNSVFAPYGIIACIDDPVVIQKILAHLQEKLTPAPAGLRPASRAPPQVGLFD